MPSLSMVFDVLAIDRASEVFKRVGDSAGEAGAKVEASTTHVSNAGSKIAAGLGIAAAAAAVMSVKMAGDFQAATTRLVTSANETQGNLEMVRKGLLDMAGQVGYSVDELATAMYKVESGGQHGAAGLQVLKAAAQGAKTENADLTTVADAVTSAMQDYHLKASDAADVTSKLVAATASGKMTFQELAGSMAAILPVASANHVSLNDILGDLASMTVHGMSAEQASQNLADAIRHLAAPTQVSQKELALLGFTAQQVSSDLSTKGLSGTVQELSQAVLKHLGPETSKVVLELGTALTGLNPAVRDLGQKLMDGTISNIEYVKAARQLAPELQGQASQFATLAKSTHAIGNEQMTGSQVMQSYSGAMKALMGDATGMNVALMLTGENTKTTTTAIENVSKATADAQGNVRGWDLIQGNFNQKLSETAGHVQAMAIEFGQHLLPALTSALGFVNSTVLPGVEHLGSAVGAVAHWFSELPQPVKDFAYALAALRLADAVGLFDRLGSVAGKFREEMALQSALFRAQSSGLSDVERALGGVASTTTAAEGGISRLGSAAAAASSRGLAALKSAGSGLVGMFGGPWGLAIAGATLGISFLISAMEKHAQQVEQDTAAIVGWYHAIAQGGPGSIAAIQKITDKHKELVAAQQQLAQVQDTVTGGSGRFGAAMQTNSGQAQVLNDKIKDLNKEFQNSWAQLTPLEQKQVLLNEAIQKYGLASQQAKDAAAAYQQELGREKTQTDQLNQAEKTHLQQLQELATQQLTAVNSSLAAQQAQLQLKTAIDQFTQSSDQGAAAQNQLAQQIISTATAAGQAAAAQAASKGVTDTANVANQAMLATLQANAQYLSGPARDAINQQIITLQNATVANANLSDAVTKMGLNVVANMDNNTAVIKGATDAQIADLRNLGFEVRALPNGTVVVTSDTGPARQQLEQLIRDYQNRQIAIAGATPGPAAVLRGGIPGAATGGPIVGPGSGTSDTAGLYALSNGEHVWTAAEVNAAGGHGAMEHMRRMVLAAGHGRADGGPIFADYPAYIAQAAMSQAEAVFQQIAQQEVAAAASSAGGAAQWAPLVLQALAMEGQPASLLGSVLRRMNQESGGNPNAINLWDSNAAAGYPSQGLMQTIPSTFAAYHYPGTSWNIMDPLANILASMNYALAVYGSLSAAYDRSGGYGLGTNFVPQDGMAFLHKGEAVVPAAKNQGAPWQDQGPRGEVVGMVNNGTIITQDIDELAWKQRLQTQRAMAAYGLR